MSRSQSQSCVQDDFFAPHEHPLPKAPSSKRVPRFFQNPERTLDPSVYDWSSYSTTPTLPRSFRRSQPDEALISSHLLLTSPLSYDSKKDKYIHAASPISKAASSSTSYLSLECTGSSNSETEYTIFSRSHSVDRVVQQPIEISLPLGRKRRSNSDATCIDSYSFVLRPAQRTRSATCSSDDTVVYKGYDPCDSKTGFQKPEPIRRTSFISEQAPGPRTIEEVERFKRRISRNRRKTALKLNYPDSEELCYQEEEEDDEEQPPRKEHPVSAILSVLRHQYVAAGLTLQLALHRAERKVVKKLNERRKSF